MGPKHVLAVVPCYRLGSFRLPAAVILLLTGCHAPAYLELSPYLQQGENTFDRPPSNFDEETYGLMFTLGWNLGSQNEAYRNLANLDVSKAGQLTLRPDGPGSLSVNVAGQEGSESIPDALMPPATKEGGLAFLYWGLGLLPAAAAYWLYRRARRNGQAEPAP